MDEQELPSIQITNNDIQAANQLSLHCPICAGPVENHVQDADLIPVVCTNCGTLYHKACWEQNGGSCAVLGCDNKSFRLHGQDTRALLKINYSDIRTPSVNGSSRRTKQLKEQQRRQVEQLRRPSLLRRLFQWLLDQIKVG